MRDFVDEYEATGEPNLSTIAGCARARYTAKVKGSRIDMTAGLGAEDCEMGMLPNDVARCAGVGDDEEGWREGCEDCARRLAEPTSGISTWMTPPAIIAFWCEFRIAAKA